MVGVAVLAVALLDASAGLCFCHRGPAVPGSASGSHSCCHGPETSSTMALRAPVSCCYIESAESAATPMSAVHLAPPDALCVGIADARAAGQVDPVLATALTGFSPPPFILRI